MNGYITNIENETLSNEFFRQVLFTGKNSQLVVMTLQPGEEIGMEVHNHIDQFIRIESGVAKVIIDEVEQTVGPDFAVVIPAGANHNVINESAVEKVRLYTIYSPPEHADGTIHKTKEEADAAEAEHHH